MYTKSQQNIPDIQNQDSGPIHNEELEKQVLASLINSYQDISEVNGILTPECFHNLNLRDVYNSVMAIYNRGDKPDILLLQNELAKINSSFCIKEIVNLCS